MEFPHLNDTNFPHLNNVDVYSYHNVFDYSRWLVGTRVRLVNVLWNSDYVDVVKFEDNAARDSWFDSQEDYYEIELTTNAQSVPDGQIKMPIPYDIMARYNYAVVSIPQMPGAEPYISYEDYIEDGVRRWHFFIDSIEYRAPNTTLCNLTLDVWTQYINDINISYMHLNRGHVGVAYSDVDEYLENPIENNEYLLTPDITPAGAETIRSCNYIPFGEGKKYMIIACTVKPSQFSRLGTISASADYSYSSNITFADIPNQRDGYQMQVNGYGIGNGYDYSNIRALADQTAANGAKIPNGLNTYAVEASDVWGEEDEAHFFQDIVATCPTFMRTIEGCFVVDESMFELMKDEPYEIAGHQIWWVRGKETITEMPELTKEDFAFPSKYERYAKLYTFPYSKMEMTDNEGNKVTVRIESMSNVRYIHKIAQLTFPFTNFRMFFSGINGKGANEYVWKNLVDADVNKLLPKSDWFDYCFEHEIPCYALYMDGDIDWMLDHFNTFAKSAMATDLASYHSTTRGANTQYENILDSDEVINTNEHAASLMSKTNSDNVADTTVENIDTNLTLNENRTARSNAWALRQTNENVSLANLTTDRDNAHSAILTTIDNDSTTSTANSNITNAFNQAMAGAVPAAVIGAATIMGGPLGMAGAAIIAGGIAGTGLAGGAANAANIHDVNQVVIAKNNSIVSDTRQYNLLSTGDKTTNAQTLAQESVNYTNDILDYDIAAQETIRDNNEDLAKTNAQNIYDNNIANSDRTKAVNDANADYIRDSLVESAQETLRARALTSQSYIADARMKTPVKIGAYSGDPKPEWNMNRGIQLKIKTMSNSEIAEVGDFFVRFGYAMNRIWEVEDLCPMNYFCYWKANELWFDDRLASNNNAQNIIHAIFTRGVTVWKNADLVGRVNVYGN